MIVKTQASSSTSKGIKIVAVTACPTGIAHTFMAAEALEQKAKEMGVEIKGEYKERDALYLRLLLVTDFLSGMTDTYAKTLYHELDAID